MENAMKLCPEGCNFASIDDRFCRMCGAELVEVSPKTFNCPNCHRSWCFSWDKFCGNCGLNILSIPLRVLNLSVRPRKAMEKLGIGTIGELIVRSEDDLLEAKNFGPSGVNEIREKLSFYFGFRLRGE